MGLMDLSTFQASQESAEELTGLLNMLNITLDLAKVSGPAIFVVDPDLDLQQGPVSLYPT